MKVEKKLSTSILLFNSIFIYFYTDVSTILLKNDLVPTSTPLNPEDQSFLYKESLDD